MATLVDKRVRANRRRKRYMEILESNLRELREMERLLLQEIAKTELELRKVQYPVDM